MSEQRTGITGGGFNARPAEEQPTPSPAPRIEGQAETNALTYRGHSGRVSNYPMSTGHGDVVVAGAALAGRSLDAMLAKLDKERLGVAQAILGMSTEGNGGEQKRILAQFAVATRRGELDEPTARQLWDCMFPGTDPASVA